MCVWRPHVVQAGLKLLPLFTMILRAGAADVHHRAQFYADLVIETKACHMLGKHSLSYVTSPVLSFLIYCHSTF